LFEADVTDVRAVLAGTPDGPLSLTAYLVWCLGHAVTEHPTVHGYIHRGGLIVFDEVDATVMVETEHGGFSFPRAHVLRDVGGRSLLDIHGELRGHQRSTQDETAGRIRVLRPLLSLPAPVRRMIYRAYLSDPKRRKRLMGTVAVTSVGMHASHGFWGVAIPQHTLQLVVGGISTRLAMIDGAVHAREMLSLTLAVDHDVVDGSPAVRFAETLTRMIEDAPRLRREIGHVEESSGAHPGE
jgi:pyruvate/2-oxoglutarate dehydrogenase complex dihydrolipoamide acyltransferase (E2) component